MQTDELDVLFRLAFVVLCLGVLICVYNITRPRGISNAFNNAEGARQDMAEAEVRGEQITSAFNNDKNGIQNHRRARIGRDETSKAENSERVNQAAIEYVPGEKQRLTYRDKSN
ncbi:uncharacterized protein LOC124820739 [Vigna umbellata]|uniref:uncharacterized protein LOC124820739 n=1 Tax=Vigna umbellata TaxID=87088 RepID=UPI001F5F4A7F|nr:uncharacterized protein LOC124820739 [Vigna umbellata]